MNNEVNLNKVRHIDALIPDLNGVFRGKRVPVENWAKIESYGLQLPGTVFSTDICGTTKGLEDQGILIGDPDLLCKPSLSTLCNTPWFENIAQVIMSMYQLDGSPYYADPRHCLQKVLDRLTQMQLSPVIALELEFYLTEYDGATQTVALPRSPHSGERDENIQVYGMTELWDYAAFLGDVERFCGVQNVDATAASSEYSPGQFEINLNHTSDVLSACEQALLLKNIVRHAANRHGFEATFMPKPFAENAGSGCHIHVSVLDAGGNNIFSSDDKTGSPALKKAIAGLLDSMPDCMAIFAPGANSYRRFIAGHFAPIDNNWDVNNRTVAVRIPVSDSQSRRLEHRMAGADVNPFLLCASVFAGIHHGLTEDIKLPARTTESHQVDSRIPTEWQRAQHVFSNSEFCKKYFGVDFVKIFAAVKQQEFDIFNKTITPLELQWYLRRA